MVRADEERAADAGGGAGVEVRKHCLEGPLLPGLAQNSFLFLFNTVMLPVA